MADWALTDGQGVETGGVTSASSTGVTVTASGSNNTKGSWAEVITSTARDAGALLVNVRKAAANLDFLLDIGTGASSAETVLIPNIKADGGGGALHRGGPIIWPVAVPRGTRIAARCQCSTASNTLRVQVIPLYGGWLGMPPLARVTDYGTATADSGAVSVDPGGSANTKGSWTQITSSTTNPMRALVLGFGNQVNSSRSAADWLVDVGIGGAGSETVLLADLHVESSTVDDVMIPVLVGPIPVNIPAGTRVAVRAQCSITDASDRLFDATIYGID